MLVESLAIFGLIFAVVILYIRAKKSNYSLATAPLLILPLANVLANMFSDELAALLSIDTFIVYAAINVLGAVISSCLVGIMSAKFGRRSVRAAYAVMSLVFNIILAAIFVYNMFETIYR